VSPDHVSWTMPFARLTTRADLASTLRLAGPVVAVEIGLMAMGAVDTMIVGRISGQAVASVAIGHAYFWVCAVFGIGVLMAIDPLLSQAVGAGDEPAVVAAVQRGLVLAGVLSVVAGLALVPVEQVLRFLRQPPEVIPDAARFTRVSIPGLLPLYAFIVLRMMLQARHRIAPLVVAIVVANLANLALNLVLVFGRFGVAPMGITGSGVASAISRYVLLVGLCLAAWPDVRAVVRPWRSEVLALRPMRRILAVGLPIAVQYELEINAFAVVAVMMGWVGATAMAGHQISINLASLTFMVPLGVSAAAAVNVGRAVGAGDRVGVRRAAGAALVTGVAFMTLSGVAMLAMPYPLARLYTADPAVLATAVALLPLAGLFQVFDGVQVVAVGILRGVGDTRTPMVINVLGFWLVGVPVSAYLGLRTPLGPQGLWIGFVFGLAAVAVLLLLRVRSRLRAETRRLSVDGPT